MGTIPCGAIRVEVVEVSHFSDKYHMDTCAGKYCNTYLRRDEMRRIEGRRGFFCPRCQVTTSARKK